MKAGYFRGPTSDELADQLSGSAEPSLASRQDRGASAESGPLLQAIESLRTRLSKLGEASLRVSETLDLNTVLKEVIDNARELTDARYGALLTYTESGAIQDFITSGLSAEEIEGLKVLPKGLGLLGYMNEIREPLRLADISSHPSSVGFPENHPPMKTFLGMPIRHRGEHVGNIYLTEKEGSREFSGEDQDVLVMFVSQAGSAIFNARRYRDERQAKSDLEALLNISPVGVLVFDGKTGDLVSANDETRRIIGRLNAPSHSLRQLLEMLSLRRPDGSEIPVDELPTMKAMARGETILADEVVIHPPGGRPPVTALVNARPIRGDNGDIVSVVATIQDITPLEEMKRQRTDFLNAVSHELRTPLSAIKGSSSTLLSSPYPVDPAETRQFLRVIDEQTDHMRDLINDLVDITHIDAGTLSVSPQPTEVADLLNLAKEAHVRVGVQRSSVALELPPELPRVLADEPRVLQALTTLLANVSRHASGSSNVRIRALPWETYVAFTVDTAAGDATSTLSNREIGGQSRTLREFAGRNDARHDLGIAICRGIVEAHGGRLWAEEGTDSEQRSFTFTIPVVEEAPLLSAEEPSRSPFARDADGARVRILVIVQDPETSRYLRNTLAGEKYALVAVSDLPEAERFIEEQDPDVILLEPMLPWADGFEVLVSIGRTSDAPIILVAGHEWQRQIGRAFELGAFDYIAKPFTTTELQARIDVALRRGGPPGWRVSAANYVHDGLSIDYTERRVAVAGRPVHLTATEYKLLSELSAAAGRVLTPRTVAETGLGATVCQRRTDCAPIHQGGAAQARGQRRTPHAHIHGTGSWLPHGEALYSVETPRGAHGRQNCDGQHPPIFLATRPRVWAFSSFLKTSASGHGPLKATEAPNRQDLTYHNALNCFRPTLYKATAHEYLMKQFKLFRTCRGL